MIYCIQSNKIEILIKFILKLINKKKKEKIFTKEFIIIQHKDIEEWLQIKIANYHEISANFFFQTIDDFIFHLFNQNINNFLNKEYPEKHKISWILAKILPLVLEKEKFKKIKKYLNKKNKNERLHKLSDHISNLFHQYLLFQPNWIKKWNKKHLVNGLNQYQKWQKYLWLLLMNEINQFKQKNKKIDCLQHSLQKIFSKNNFSKRIFFFGITNYPPFYFKIIKKIAKKIEIYLLFFNPCRNNELNNSKQLCFNPQKNKKNDPNKENILFFIKNKNFFENYLINLWGQTREKNLRLISKLKNLKEKKIFIEPKKNSLLHYIQSDILNSENHIQLGLTKTEFIKNTFKRKIKKEDQSISINSCYNQKNEIQILKNFLIQLLEKNKKITPKDIIIMAPNINLYKPYIKNIFSSFPKKNDLPFNILDQNIYENNQNLKTFISLLNLPKIRFTSKQILQFLKNLDLSAKFNIEENELRLLYKWIIESKIRWGIDKNHIKKLKLPITNQNTWSVGIKKILLGTIMKNKINIWNNLYPYDMYKGLSNKLLKNFLNFFELLVKWKNILNTEKKLKDWLTVCELLLKDFFNFNEKNKNVFYFIIKKWKKIINDGILINYKKKISLNIIKNKLLMHLKKEKKQNFISGKINFCTIKKNRTIPSKIICLLGINNSFYPRVKSNLELNLINQKTTYEDLENKKKERYLFLEILTLASKIFYISYFKYDIKNNKMYNRSTIIEDLVNYISYSFYLEESKFLNLDRNAKKIKKHLIKKHKKLSIFSKILNCENDDTQKKLILKKKKIKKIEFCNQMLKKEKKSDLILLKNLLLFYKHPIKFFFQKRLKISFELENIKLKEEENFSLNNLEKYEFNSILLKNMLNKYSKKKILDFFFAKGFFPTKNYGKIYLEKQMKILKPLIKNIKKYKQKNFNKKFSISFKKIKVKGKFIKIQENGILRYKPKKLTILDGLSLWIEHLFLCLTIRSSFSIYFGLNNTRWYFQPIEQKKAKNYLKEIIMGYIDGIRKPFPLFCYSGWNWIISCYDKKKKKFDFQSKKILKKAEVNLKNTMIGKYTYPGEINDLYNNRAFNNINKKLIKKIKKNALKYLLPIIISNKMQ